MHVAGRVSAPIALMSRPCHLGRLEFSSMNLSMTGAALGAGRYFAQQARAAAALRLVPADGEVVVLAQ